MGTARSPDFLTLRVLSDELVRWLHKDALPLWDKYGVDRNLGGYFENLAINAQTRSVRGAGPVRRGRVVARQIFVFDAGYRAGWRSEFSHPVRHGCDYLFSRLHRGGGLFHTAVDASSHHAAAPFSLYETAFYLFALARVHTSLGHDYPTEAAAIACLDALRRGWGKVNGGFEESEPPSLPLKSNPHMHLLEAALAWVEAADGPKRAVWVELAREIVELCCTRFSDESSGAIREYFDADWRALPDRADGLVEPGHQFEWSWLLMQWAASPHCDPARRESYRDLARRLALLGERCGVDPTRGVALNELWGDLTPKDLAAKLWPQTERLKAWCAMLEHARADEEADAARLKIREAAAGMTRFFLPEPAGMWQEMQLPDGTFTLEPCKASSFYHIVCAIETLRQTVEAGDSPKPFKV